MAAKKKTRTPLTNEERAAHLEDLLDGDIAEADRRHYIAALASLGHDYDDGEADDSEADDDDWR